MSELVDVDWPETLRVVAREHGVGETAITCAAAANAFEGLSRLTAEERRELESLREWRRVVSGAPESAQAEVRARMIASQTLAPITQVWRERVALLERAYASAAALLADIGVDDDWENAEGVSVAPALVEYRKRADALRRPFLPESVGG